MPELIYCYGLFKMPHTSFCGRPGFCPPFFFVIVSPIARMSNCNSVLQ